MAERDGGLPPPPPLSRDEGLGGDEEVILQTDFPTSLTISSRENLVEKIISSGDLSRMDAAVSRLDALRAYELAVRIRRAQLEVLGPDHIDVACKTGSLAELLRKQCKLDDGLLSVPQKALVRQEATKAFESAIDGFTRTLGRDHVSTLLTIRGLANLLEDERQLDLATRNYRLAMDGLTRAVGPDHAETLTTATCLANVFREQYHFEDAKKLYERVVEGQTRAFGADHPSTLLSTMNVVRVLMTQANVNGDRGMFEEAVKMNERVVEDLTKALGPDHADTLDATFFLADGVLDQGCGRGGRGGLFCKGDPRKLWRSMRLIERVVDGRTRTLGPEHPDTANSKFNLTGVRAALCCCFSFCCCFTCFFP